MQNFNHLFSIAPRKKKRIGKQILTKKPFVFDTVGQSDTEDITNTYKSSEGE